MAMRIRRPSHPTAVAYLALFLAMGGTASAAAAMWTGSNIVDGSLTNVDLANNSVTGAKIADGTITSTDLAPGAASGGGGSGYELITQTFTVSAVTQDGTYPTVTFACPAGKAFVEPAPRIMFSQYMNLSGDLATTTIAGRIVPTGWSGSISWQNSSQPAMDETATFACINE